MAELIYNISERLQYYLKTSEEIRKNILLFPISPKTEMRLKWETNVQRIKWTLALQENPLSNAKIIEVFTKNPKRLNLYQKEAVSARNAFRYIRENWLVNPRAISVNTIKTLYKIACQDTLGKMTGFTGYSQEKLSKFLEYLHKGREHPIIQAGLAQIQTFNIVPFDKGNARIARLLSYLFLYKNGYDVREMLVLEEFYKMDLVAYKNNVDAAISKKNLTFWLEYFTFGVMTQLKRAQEIVQNQKFLPGTLASYWKLNERQRGILTYLEKPDLRITNKEVQKKFKVSQITASRDLSKLANLGLLFPHGKGRSVFYTRV